MACYSLTEVLIIGFLKLHNTQENFLDKQMLQVRPETPHSLSTWSLLLWSGKGFPREMHSATQPQRAGVEKGCFNSEFPRSWQSVQSPDAEELRSWKGTRPHVKRCRASFTCWFKPPRSYFHRLRLPFTSQEEMVFSKPQKMTKGSITKLNNLWGVNRLRRVSVTWALP